ncbi:MAG: hypothetical protein ABFS86_16690 [Planctomycetota bacterium]
MMGPEMMSKMMPQGLGMMLSTLPREERLEFAKGVVAQACEGLGEKERREFLESLAQELDPSPEEE